MTSERLLFTQDFEGKHYLDERAEQRRRRRTVHAATTRRTVSESTLYRPDGVLLRNRSIQNSICKTRIAIHFDIGHYSQCETVYEKMSSKRTCSSAQCFQTEISPRLSFLVLGTVNRLVGRKVGKQSVLYYGLTPVGAHKFNGSIPANSFIFEAIKY